MSEEESYRPQRRPIAPVDAAPANAAREAAGINIPGETPAGVAVEGTRHGLPPQLLAAMQKKREENPEVNEEQRGPRTRQTPTKVPTVQPAGEVNSSDKLKQLLAGLERKKATFDKITLPSRGRFYDGENGPSDGVIHVRPMTGEEEQILATPRFVKSGNAINMIFNKCIQEQFPSQKFLTPDRTYLLIFLRGISYTPNYDVEVKCPHCDRKFAHVIDLNSLYVDPCPDDFGPENLSDVLPASGLNFSYHLSTGEDEQVIQQYRERKAKFDTSNVSDDTLLYRTAMMVQEIEGISDKLEIQRLLRSLPVGDLSTLRNIVNEPPFGVDTKVEIPCVVCQNDFEIDLPLETSFFFPKARKKAPTQA